MKANRLTEHNSIGRVAVLFMILCLVATLVIGCEPSEQARREGEMALPVLSPVFQEGDTIPTKYTCQGQDIPPPLVWREPPAGTQTFTLILDDLDAPSGVFTRWILFNIPSNSRELLEALP